MQIGYARVSKDEQNLDLQVDALRRAGCERVFTEKVSGTSAERFELDAAISHLREGDTFTIWKLDRFGRSALELIQIADDLKNRGIHFKSITEHVDTSTPAGQFVYTVFAGLAQLERSRLIERTHAGLTAARARGRVGGRKRVHEKKAKSLIVLALNTDTNITQLCADLGVSRATYYRYKKLNENVGRN